MTGTPSSQIAHGPGSEWPRPQAPTKEAINASRNMQMPARKIHMDLYVHLCVLVKCWSMYMSRTNMLDDILTHDFGSGLFVGV